MGYLGAILAGALIALGIVALVPGKRKPPSIPTAQVCSYLHAVDRQEQRYDVQLAKLGFPLIRLPALPRECR